MKEVTKLKLKSISFDIIFVFILFYGYLGNIAWLQNISIFWLWYRALCSCVIGFAPDEKINKVILMMGRGMFRYSFLLDSSIVMFCIAIGWTITGFILGLGTLLINTKCREVFKEPDIFEKLGIKDEEETPEKEIFG